MYTPKKDQNQPNKQYISLTIRYFLSILMVLMGSIISTIFADSIKGANTSDTGVPMHSNSAGAFVQGFILYFCFAMVPSALELYAILKRREQKQELRIFPFCIILGLTAVYSTLFLLFLAFVTG